VKGAFLATFILAESRSRPIKARQYRDHNHNGQADSNGHTCAPSRFAMKVHSWMRAGCARVVVGTPFLEFRFVSAPSRTRNTLPRRVLARATSNIK
jgi:hypothetical protein